MSNNIANQIFRAYDIRGIVDEQIDEHTVEEIGKALGTEVLAQDCKSIVVARDGRLSSPALSAALNRGLLATGINVIDVGLAPTPVLYYATIFYNTKCGAMLTASHNPAQYNGIKMMIAGRTIHGDDIQNLYQRIVNQDYVKSPGSYQENFIIENYIADIVSKIKLNKKLKVVIDCGNGIAAVVAPELYKAMGVEVISLYDELDGNFPNHHPDPGKLENLQDLITAVKVHNADLGLAFDGDADRLGVVTHTGDVIMPDRQMMLFAESVLKINPGSTIVFDVKCSSKLAEFILDHGGKPCMSKTGHSYIKNEMIENGALLAGEMSGHIFFKQRWYGFDDALYSGARLLEILANDYPTRTLQDLCSQLPDSINTPEINIAIPDDKKFDFIDKLADNHGFESYKQIIDIDGLRVEYPDGWGLIRASNTTPCLVLRFEADSQDALDRIKQDFRTNITNIDSGLDLSF